MLAARFMWAAVVAAAGVIGCLLIPSSSRARCRCPDLLVIIEDEARPPAFFDEHDLAAIGVYEEAELAGGAR